MNTAIMWCLRRVCFQNQTPFNSKPPFTDTSSFTLFVSFAKHLRPNQLEQIFNKFGKLKGITFLS